MGFDGPGKPLRDLQDPTRHQQPKLMKDYIASRPPYDVDNDWGGVHDNSGIHNFAAYQIITAQDTRGRHLFKPDELAAMFYIALSVHLSRTSHFSDSRRGLVQATRSLFRSKPAAQVQARVAAVEAAFDAVGIKPAPGPG
jgi:Zn-dependent metalloprotease